MNRSAPAVQPHRLRQLLQRLINIYSPSGKEEELVGFLNQYLRHHGLPVVLQQVDGHRSNVLVMHPETDVHLVLIGHIDTVVAYDLDHYSYQEEGDLVVGLGASDMKGGCAAMIEAFIALWKAGFRDSPAALALVVGEEEEGDGTRKLVKDFHFPWAVIGEPTNLHPCLSHYGYLEVQITTEGKRMHASLANMGQNPINLMLRLLLKISHYIETKRPEAVYNIRELSSSQAGFAVPEWCDAWLDLHLPPAAPIGEITLELEEILLREREEDPDFNGTIRFATIHAGYALPDKGKIVESIRTVCARHSLPWDPQPFRSHSDANLLWAAGIKPILLGPGQLEKAQAPDESISFQQVTLAAQLYLDLLVALSS